MPKEKANDHLPKSGTMKELLDLYNRGDEFVVFDCEFVQGQGKTNRYMIEAGGIVCGKDVKSTQKIDALLYFTTTVWPQYYDSLHVCGIGIDDLKGGRDRLEVFQELHKLLSGRHLVCHTHADINTIDMEFRRYKAFAGNTMPIANYFDTMKLAKEVYPSLGKYGLKDICKFLKVKYQNAHRAYQDADMTKKCLQRMIRDASSFGQNLKGVKNKSTGYLFDITD